MPFGKRLQAIIPIIVRCKNERKNCKFAFSAGYPLKGAFVAFPHKNRQIQPALFFPFIPLCLWYTNCKRAEGF